VKRHYHTGVEPLVVMSIAIPLLWHGYRWAAAGLAKRSGLAGKIGESVGGFFTFGGLA